VFGFFVGFWGVFFLFFGLVVVFLFFGWGFTLSSIPFFFLSFLIIYLFSLESPYKVIEVYFR